MTTDLTPAAMVENYIKLRDYKKAAEDEFKTSMERVRLGMEKLESMILDHLNVNELDNIKCEAGTAYKKVEYSATVKDREAFLKYLRESEDWDALDARANKKYVREQVEKATMIPGVEMSSITNVGVRRS